MVDPAIDIADEIAKDFEGLSLIPYHDPVGYPTIGYGHLLSRQPWADLSAWSDISEDHAVYLLQRDMGKASAAVNRLITVELPDERRAALIDFAFNCGSGNLQVSTLRRVINRREFDKAPAQFMRWVYAHKVKLPGLVRRRAAEAMLWESVSG